MLHPVLSRNMKKARHAAGMTQEQVAEAAGMQVAVYSRIERAEVDPRYGSLVRIAAALKVKMPVLTTGTEAR